MEAESRGQSFKRHHLSFFFFLFLPSSAEAVLGGNDPVLLTSEDGSMPCYMSVAFLQRFTQGLLCLLHPMGNKSLYYCHQKECDSLLYWLDLTIIPLKPYNYIYNMSGVVWRNVLFFNAEPKSILFCFNSGLIKKC